jgi:hypothetical protein
MIILFALGFFYTLTGDTGQGIALCDESLKVNGDNDERWCRGYAHYAKGIAFWVRGEHQTCAELMRAGLLMKHELGDLMGIVNALEVLGWVAAKEGHHRRTAWLMGAAHSLWWRVGSPLYGMEILQEYHDAAELCAQQALGHNGYEEDFRVGTTLTLDQAVNLATIRMPPSPPAIHEPGDQDR